ncbi:MAG: magnesium and cobalt transport protein CorA [Solirubrobacteraceae bacterium]|nr:magnesium and cobalt transport protein CorA [Solirubrobacteraceae bacterium]
MGEFWHGEVQQAAYRDGVRLDDNAVGPPDLRLVWVQHPSPEEIIKVAQRFGIPEPVVQQIRAKHTRARVLSHGRLKFFTLRPARYIDKTEQVQFGELQLVVGPDFVVLLGRCRFFNLDHFVESLERRPDQLSRGPSTVLHAALDAVVDSYEPVALGLENDIDEIEDQVFRGDEDPLRRIYELIREVIAFQRGVDPLEGLLGQLLRREELPEEEKRFLMDAHDRALQARERAASFRSLLESVLQVNLALETKRLSEVSIAQADQTKKISSWAAVLFTPTLIAGIYGMNFRHMPELKWEYGYPFAIGLMLLIGGLLFAAFRRRDWI